MNHNEIRTMLEKEIEALREAIDRAVSPKERYEAIDALVAFHREGNAGWIWAMLNLEEGPEITPLEDFDF